MIAEQDYEFGDYRNRVRVNGVKLMLDGSPQGKTAFISKPISSHLMP